MNRILSIVFPLYALLVVISTLFIALPAHAQTIGYGTDCLPGQHLVGYQEIWNGFTYEYFPVCEDDAPPPPVPTCADSGQLGTYPSCYDPAPPPPPPVITCADLGMIGTYPACSNPPPPPTCADFGQLGTYPSCYAPPTPTCADSGQLGTYPSCYTPAPPTCADSGQLGTYPSCYAPPPTGCVPDGTCTAANTCSGQSCTNNCGTVVNGTKTGGFCPVTPPPTGPGTCTNPTVSITASATRVNSGTSIMLTVAGSGLNQSCTVTGTGSGSSMNEVITVNSCNLNPNPSNLATPPITTQSTFTVTCLDGPAGSTSVVASASTIVNINPTFKPF